LTIQAKVVLFAPMTLYTGPDSLKDPYHQSKFVRVGDQVALGQDNK